MGNLGPQFKNYADNVDAKTYGMDIRTSREERELRAKTVAEDTNSRERVPVHKIWGTQGWLHPATVDSLTSADRRQIPVIRGEKYPDGTYQTYDHHRVAAAKKRGDKVIPMDVLRTRRWRDE